MVYQWILFEARIIIVIVTMNFYCVQNLFFSAGSEFRLLFFHHCQIKFVRGNVQKKTVYLLTLSM